MSSPVSSYSAMSSRGSRAGGVHLGSSDPISPRYSNTGHTINRDLSIPTGGLPGDRHVPMYHTSGFDPSELPVGHTGSYDAGPSSRYSSRSSVFPASPAQYKKAGPFHDSSLPYDPRENNTRSRMSSGFPAPDPFAEQWPDAGRAYPGPRSSTGSLPPLSSHNPWERASAEFERVKRSSPESFQWDGDESPTWTHSDGQGDNQAYKTSSRGPRVHHKGHPQRRPSNRDEFDGPHQYLDRPSPETIAAQERELPHLSTNLYVNEQDELLSKVNDCLSKCAFDFIAKYQFPIPLEPDKRLVTVPSDREWTEWVYLLKRLATKRRIPARVLYNGQIKQLVTVLENSLEMRHAAKHQSRPLKDDRNVLQLISAGLQVAKILKDAEAMKVLDHLYVTTEKIINSRIGRSQLR